MMAERISACDKVLEKKYIIDIFEDGSTELTAMVKVLWDAVFVLLAAPVKKRKYFYTFDSDKVYEEMSAKACNKRLSSIFAGQFHAAAEIIDAEDFLKDKSEDELFELYQKMLDLDMYHYMTGTKGYLVVGSCEKAGITYWTGYHKIKHPKNQGICDSKSGKCETQSAYVLSGKSGNGQNGSCPDHCRDTS